MKENKKKNKWIGWLIFFGLIISVLVLLQSSSFLRLNIESYGHGDIATGGFTSLLQSLRIVDSYNYIDESGEGFCFDNDCWDETDDIYYDCHDECSITQSNYCSDHSGGIYTDEYEYCMASYSDEIIACEDECEAVYEETLMSECNEECEEEIYTWDGTPVNDLGAFAVVAFPDFAGRSELICEDWIMNGEWVSQTDKVGCINVDGILWIYCNSNSLTSAGEVCETIGKTWTCSEVEAFCS